MTGDARVTAAREYLDAIRPYKVSDRPHSVLMREDAELRRMLGNVLAVIDGRPPALTPQQRVVLAQALADAVTYRDPGGNCPDCRAHPAGLCEDHAADLDKADSYRELARELGDDQ